MTVKELLDVLKDFPLDAKVLVLNNSEFSEEWWDFECWDEDESGNLRIW